MISTCSISRRCGAPTLRISTKGINACMLTIGKTSGGSLSNFLIVMNNALSGTPGLLFRFMVMVAKMSFYAHLVTVGRSKNIIQRIIK